MSTRRRQGYFLAVLFAALLNAAGVFLSVGYAQVTTNITSSGLGTTINGSTSAPCLGGTCNITGGDRRGQNLFHSFGRFDIGAGNTANFSNDSGLATSNIIGRVTGGLTSNIFGTIQTTNFGTANLFLLNPAGILFGSTARLNVGGSFHATTADYIKLQDNGIIYADPAKASALTSAPPSAFGFLSGNPGRIDVQAGTLTNTFSVLQVPPGDNKLSFVGGPVNVGPPSGQSRAGFLRAPGGRINLVSVASAGEAVFDGSGFNVDSFQQLGQINLTGGSIVDGKSVFIRGGDVAITSGTIFPGFFTAVSPVATSNGVPAPTVGGGEVNIRVANGVTIGGPFILVAPGIQFVGPLGAGTSVVTADVPNITIQAGSFRLLGQSATIQSRQPQIQTIRRGPGQSPLITVTADTVEVRNGAFILVGNLYANSLAEGAGEIVVNARDVTLSSDGNSTFTGLAAQGTFHPSYGATAAAASFSELFTTADSGSITINATGKLTMLQGAQVTTDSLAFGKSGNVTINAGDALLVGAGANTGAIAAQSILAGASGNVTINTTRAIDVQNGFRVSTNTGGSGDAGVVSLTGASITATGADTRIQSGAAQPPDTDSNLNTFASKFNNFFGRSLNYATLRTLLGVKPRPGDLMDVLNQLNARGLTKVADLTPGNGGKVVISTPVLTLDAGARIETSTLWDGNAGAVVGNVGSLSIQGGASIRSASGGQRSPDGVVIGTGNAGDVTFTAAGSISISDAGSSISTTTFGNGNAGNISLKANQVNLQNGGSVTSESGGTLAGQLFVGAGNAGIVGVTGTGTISLSGAGSTISTSTLGNGSGGDVSLTAGNSVSIVNGALVSADSLSTNPTAGLAGNITIAAGDQIQMNSGSVSTRAVTSDGGNITMNAPRMIQLTDSQITTSVESGVGGGGNINIDPRALILNNSQILANAFGGPGGNINITADVFLVNSGGMLPNSLAGIVDASSALSTPGTVNIEATFTNVTGSVTLLPETPLKATELLRASCAARFAGGKTSSLVLGGRGGLPLQPGDLLPSPLYVASDADTPSTGNKVSGQDQATRFSLLGPKDRFLNRYSFLPNAKCAL
jgi:filamentous hemagglutinin family protein